MKQYYALFIIASTILLLPLLNVGVFAQSDAQNTAEKPMVVSTDKGSIDVELSLSPLPLEPEQETKMHIRFLQKGTTVVQQHIDYQVFVEKDGKEVFRIPLTHTNPGTVTIPYMFTSPGSFTAGVEVEGILFQPIPKETATFSVSVIPEFSASAVVAMVGAIAVALLFTRRLIPSQLKI